jgi:hypothetical protein
MTRREFEILLAAAGRPGMRAPFSNRLTYRQSLSVCSEAGRPGADRTVLLAAGVPELEEVAKARACDYLRAHVLLRRTLSIPSLA